MTFKRLSKTSKITICSIKSNLWESMDSRLIIQVYYFQNNEQNMRGEVIVEYETKVDDVVGYHEKS